MLFVYSHNYRKLVSGVNLRILPDLSSWRYQAGYCNTNMYETCRIQTYPDAFFASIVILTNGIVRLTQMIYEEGECDGGLLVFC